MLTYENDPLLNKYSGSFVLNGNVLNLYSAFVKKEDFIKKGKKIQPLQKSTYVKVNKEIIDKIKNRYTFEETSKLIEYYTGLRNNIKRRLNIWYKNCRIPFLLLRLTSLNKEEFSK